MSPTGLAPTPAPYPVSPVGVAVPIPVLFVTLSSCPPHMSPCPLFLRPCPMVGMAPSLSSSRVPHPVGVPSPWGGSSIALSPCPQPVPKQPHERHSPYHVPIPGLSLSWCPCVPGGGTLVPIPMSPVPSWSGTGCPCTVPIPCPHPGWVRGCPSPCPSVTTLSRRGPQAVCGDAQQAAGRRGCEKDV